MKITLLVATDLAGGIGNKGGIPWRCSRDLKHFKERTLNKVVVMGRKTVESLPFKLKGRGVVMLSKTLDDHPKADYTAQTFGEAIARYYDTPEIIIAGGAEVYEEAIKRGDVDEIYISTIFGVWPCDTHFDLKYLEDFDRTLTTFYPQKDEDPAFTISHFVRR